MHDGRAMNKLAVAVLAAALGITGCTDSDGGATDVGAAPLQASAGTLFGTAKSTESRLVDCRLAYESFAPSFASRPAATLSATFGQLGQGMAVSDGAFTLVVSTNAGAPYDAPLAQIFDDRSNTELSHDAQPHGGGNLLDIDAQIAPNELDGVVFDHLHASCSLR